MGQGAAGGAMGGAMDSDDKSDVSSSFSEDSDDDVPIMRLPPSEKKFWRHPFPNPADVSDQAARNHPWKLNCVRHLIKKQKNGKKQWSRPYPIRKSTRESHQY